MADPLHVQLAVPAAPSAVFDAWTDSDSLMAWFAEFADIRFDEHSFDYWGRLRRDARPASRDTTS